MNKMVNNEEYESIFVYALDDKDNQPLKEALRSKLECSCIENSSTDHETGVMIRTQGDDLIKIINDLDSIKIPNCIFVGAKKALSYEELEKRREFYKSIPEMKASLKKASEYIKDIVSRFPKGESARSNI